MGSVPDSAFQQLPFSLFPQSHIVWKIQNFGHTSKAKDLEIRFKDFDFFGTFVPSVRWWADTSKLKLCTRKAWEYLRPRAASRKWQNPLQRIHRSLVFGRPAGHKHRAGSCSLPTPINKWWDLPLKEHFPLLCHLLPSFQQQEQLPCSITCKKSKKIARNPTGKG